MFTSNTSHAATQGLIPDVVPIEHRGKFSGVKALFELPIPVIFVSLVLAPFVAKNNIFMALLITSIVLIISMAITMFVKEVPIEKSNTKIEWKPFLNLVWMTLAFTIVILGMGEIVKFGASLALFGNHRGLLVALGVAAMSVAVVIGVWLSIRLALGKKESAQRKSYTWWVINRLAFMVGLTNLATFMVYFMQEKFGFVREAAAGPASQVTMLVGVFVLLLALPTGWLSDKFGKKMMLVISGCVATVGVLVLLLIPQLAGIYVAGGLIGAASGIFYSANWALGTELVPAEKAGKFLGIQNLAGAGAGAVGAYLGGPIADQVGYTTLFAIYGFIFILSVIALIGIKEPASYSAT
jgi:MFS family permease